MNLKVNTKEILEVTNNDTNEKSYLILEGGEWTTITEEEYKKIIEDEKNDNI